MARLEPGRSIGIHGTYYMRLSARFKSALEHNNATKRSVTLVPWLYDRLRITTDVRLN